MHVDTVGCRSLDSLVLLTPSFVKNIKAKHCISGHTSSTTQLMEAGSRPTSGPCCPGQPFTRTLLPTVTKQTCPWSLAKSGRHGLIVMQWHPKVTLCVPLWPKRPRSQSYTETVEENFSLKSPGKVLRESSVKRQSPKLFRVRLEYPWPTTILKLWPILDDKRSDQRSKFSKILSNDFCCPNGNSARCTVIMKPVLCSNTKGYICSIDVHCQSNWPSIFSLSLYLQGQKWAEILR